MPTIISPPSFHVQHRTLTGNNLFPLWEQIFPVKGSSKALGGNCSQCIAVCLNHSVSLHSIPGFQLPLLTKAQKFRHRPAELVVPGLIPTGNRSLFNCQWVSIAHRLSLSCPGHYYFLRRTTVPYHPDMTEMMLEREQNHIIYPSMSSFNIENLKFNPIAFGKAKTLWSFGLSERNRVRE